MTVEQSESRSEKDIPGQMHARVHRAPDGDDQGDAHMVEIADAVIESLQRFLAAVRKVRRVEAAYLYGSQAKGTATRWSDIDVAVISPDFTGDLFQERLLLMRLAAQVDDRIEPYPFRPADFDPTAPLVNEIRRTGVRVA
jgi:predicted nucleotidyltransferase